MLTHVYNAGFGCSKGEQRYQPDSVFCCKLSKHVLYLIKPICNFSIFKLKSLFVSCEFNIPGVITFRAFYPVASAIHAPFLQLASDDQIVKAKQYSNTISLIPD